MSFRNPDVELHLTGWPAVIVISALVLAALTGILQGVLELIGKL